jgi:hypothetical protein
MTESLATEIARAKMHELGITDYLFRYRHFQISSLGKLELKDYNDTFILLVPDPDTRVFSHSGIYDVKDRTIAEMQYVFRGRITVDNLSTKNAIQVKFLQVIAINKTP